MLTPKQRHCLHHMVIPYWQLRSKYKHHLSFYICMVECHKQPYCCFVYDKEVEHEQPYRLLHQLALSLQGQMASSYTDYNLPHAPYWIFLGATAANRYHGEQRTFEEWSKQTPSYNTDAIQYVVIPDLAHLLQDPQLKAHAWHQIQSLMALT